MQISYLLLTRLKHSVKNFGPFFLRWNGADYCLLNRFMSSGIFSKKTISRKQAKNAEDLKTLASQRVEVETTQTQLKLTKEELEEAQAEVRTAKTELEEAQAEGRATKAELEEAQAEGRTAKAELEEAQAEGRTAKAELEEAQAKVRTAKTELEEAQTEGQATRLELEKLHTTVQSAYKLKEQLLLDVSITRRAHEKTLVDLEQMRAKAGDFEQRLMVVLCSLSWRITALPRGLINFTGRMFSSFMENILERQIECKEYIYTSASTRQTLPQFKIFVHSIECPFLNLVFYTQGQAHISMPSISFAG